MPEGPEVRKYADAVAGVLSGRAIRSLTARTREARHWLAANGTRLANRRVISVRSHGKHLIGGIEGGFYFHSHLMMWGRWQTFVPDPPAEVDRRERARIIVVGGAAILYSAPIFNVGEGDPVEQVEHLSTLGPDVLPYLRAARSKTNVRLKDAVSTFRGSGWVQGGVGTTRKKILTVSGGVYGVGTFNAAEFRRRLQLPEHRIMTIGAALLNQRIVAGLGNYLRAEVLFACRLNPWTKVEELKKRELSCLSKTIPELALRSYIFGVTASDEDRERMRTDSSLVYKGRQQDWIPGQEYGTRYMIFRRTNLPCLHCGNPIKQLRQTTNFSQTTQQETINGTDLAQATPDFEERSRIIYFCANCQGVEPS